MSEQELNFVLYLNRIQIEAMLFDDDFSIDDMKAMLFKENFLINNTEINLIVIEEIVEEASYGYYPEIVLKNLEKIINSLKNISNTKIEEIINKYEQIKDITTDEKVYLIEAFYKVMDSTYLKYLDYITLDKEALKDSIRFDSVTINTLINNDMEILETELYIFSIKKFLIEFPEMFLDKNINKRALQVLEKNKDIKDAERLIYKVKHIKKFKNNNFNLIIYKALYDYIVLKNMLNNNKVFNDNIDKINSDIIDNLYEIIDQELIKDDKNKDIAYRMLQEYKEKELEKLNKEEKKVFVEKINNYIGKLNSIREYNNDIIISEYVSRLDGINKIKYLFNILDLDNLIINDLQVMNLYMFDEEKYIEKREEIDHKDIYLSINKFLKLTPSIFDDETIYKRTIELLDNNDYKTKKVKNKVKKIYEGR